MIHGIALHNSLLSAKPPWIYSSSLQLVPVTQVEDTVMAMEGATATQDTLDSTVKYWHVLVTQVEDTVITMEGATATQDTLDSTVMRC